MTTNIEQAKEALDRYRDEIANVRKDTGLTAEGKTTRLLKVSAGIDAQLNDWKAEVATKAEQIESDLAKMETVAPVSRKFDSETVSVLEYWGKIIKSKIAAEGSTQQGFNETLLDIVDNGGEATRLAFIDNYHEILALTENFEHDGKDSLIDYYHRAKNHMKTPEQTANEEAYEKAVSEASGLQSKLQSQLMAVERNVTELKASFSADIHGHETGKAKTTWG